MRKLLVDGDYRWWKSVPVTLSALSRLALAVGSQKKSTIIVSLDSLKAWKRHEWLSLLVSPNVFFNWLGREKQFPRQQWHTICLLFPINLNNFIRPAPDTHKTTHDYKRTVIKRNQNCVCPAENFHQSGSSFEAPANPRKAFNASLVHCDKFGSHPVKTAELIRTRTRRLLLCSLRIPIQICCGRKHISLHTIDILRSCVWTKRWHRLSLVCVHFKFRFKLITNAEMKRD